MKQYLSCLRKNELKNEKCRDISKAYLQCRFDQYVHMLFHPGDAHERTLEVDRHGRTISPFNVELTPPPPLPPSSLP